MLSHLKKTNDFGIALMKPPILLNENNKMETTGDINVFLTTSALESHLEPWYIDESHFIFDSEGRQLEMTTDGRRVRVIPKEPPQLRPEIALLYFRDFLRGIAEAKGWDVIGTTEDFVDNATLSELADRSAKFGRHY
jgi:hypothetical protein